MPRKRRTPKRPELLSRTVAITSLAMRVGIRVDQRRGETPEIEAGPWLELRGTLDNPVKAVEDVLFGLYAENDPQIGPARPAGIGAVIGLKPEMSVVISWSHREFDRLWTLALSGQLRFADLLFTKPHYGKARVVNASFSTEREE